MFVDYKHSQPCDVTFHLQIWSNLRRSRLPVHVPVIVMSKPCEIQSSTCSNSSCSPFCRGALPEDVIVVSTSSPGFYVDNAFVQRGAEVLSPDREMDLKLLVSYSCHCIALGRCIKSRKLITGLCVCSQQWSKPLRFGTGLCNDSCSSKTHCLGLKYRRMISD